MTLYVREGESRATTVEAYKKLILRDWPEGLLTSACSGAGSGVAATLIQLV
jgi:hypothetical protein